jgi:flagellar protein FlbD
MITLHNVQGQPIAINGSLIERVDGGPETHVLLVSGTSYIVTESLEEVVRLHREDRAAVQALADALGLPATAPPADGQEPSAPGERALRLLTRRDPGGGEGGEP